MSDGVSPFIPANRLLSAKSQLIAILKRAPLRNEQRNSRLEIRVSFCSPLPPCKTWDPSAKNLGVFQWTICAYRKPGMSEEDYHRYMSEKHAPLVKGLLAKYGIVKFSMTHNTSETRKLMTKIAGPQFDNNSCRLEDIEDFVRMKADPYWRDVVAPDHEKFADTTRSRMTTGWVEDHVIDGQVVE